VHSLAEPGNEKTAVIRSVFKRKGTQSSRQGTQSFPDLIRYQLMQYSTKGFRLI
jgi:hypothetical protein